MNLSTADQLRHAEDAAAQAARRVHELRQEADLTQGRSLGANRVPEARAKLKDAERAVRKAREAHDLALQAESDRTAALLGDPASKAAARKRIDAAEAQKNDVDLDRAGTAGTHLKNLKRTAADDARENGRHADAGGSAAVHAARLGLLG